MTINHDPDKKMEKVESTKDEEIIELKEEAIDTSQEDEEIVELKEEAIDTSQDDEEIIDLLEEADEPDEGVVTEGILAQEPESEQDSDLIELEEEIFDVSQDEEEIIDLLEEAGEPEVTHEEESIVFPEVESSEEILTLTESMSDTPQEIEEIGEPLHITVDISQEEALTDVTADILEEPGVLDDESGQEVDSDQALNNDFVDSLGMEIDSEEDVSEGLLESEKVSDAQVEAALERVVKNMFYEKIDGILVEVIEKTVTREIERLKSILLQDAAGNQK